ncbi:PIN domain-containing protein [uncultured Hyphomonas sp.]|uniref:PIN domain-containing protein n=1 Tax=uncultured Hyphomonas sp. TaxID=225298 RepID=UPI002AABC907|nr:PIN domain-containing protein [uncultured Hyphomonas sp.]
MSTKPSPLFFVFVDTQVYRKERLNRQSSNIQSLRRRVYSGSVRVLSTSVLRRELAAQALTIQNEFIQATRKAVANSGVAELSGDARIGTLLDLEKNQINSTKIKQSADRLLSYLQADEVDIPDDGLSTIFDWYFAGLPPFGAKGKKSEFPDAANKLALLHYARSNHVTVSIVSGDEDWKKTCEKQEEFDHYDRLEMFLDEAVRSEFVSREFWSDEEILTSLTPHLKEITNALQREMMRSSRVNLGDGQMDSLSIQALDLQDILITDIWEKGDSFKCLGELTFEAEVEAQFSLDDPELANILEEEYFGSIVRTAEIRFQLDGLDPRKISNIQLQLTDSLDFHVPLRYTG